MQLNKEKLSSPTAIFIVYIIAAFLFILSFRLIFPGEAPPLPAFSQNWRLIRGVLDILTLFPALAFSALVVPFGIASEESNYTSFSQHLFQQLMKPLITAICAAGIYAALFFLVLPLAENYEENLRYQGDVYKLVRNRARIHMEDKEWLEASQLIGICERIWEKGPEVAAMRNEVNIHLEELQFLNSWQIGDREPAKNLNSASVSALPGQGEPMNAGEAIAMGEAALADERPFDAHWLATLSGRIARAGSPESTMAAQLAARAWNQIESQQPTREEIRVYSHFRLKLSGYEAMVSGDWIRAFYIFKELIELTPHDPDAANFLAASEKGAKESAFFIDEMEMSPGEMLTDTIFSLPFNQEKGPRSVLRIGSLSSTTDYAYGTGIEYMVFDSDAHPMLQLQAPYAKFLPITLNGQQQVLIMMRALDRHDRNTRWEPEYSDQASGAQNNAIHFQDMAQITLNISYETFLMLSEMRQELPGMHINALFAAAEKAGAMGYIPEVFQAEILNRLGACVFFLPMAVIAIVIGWRLRAKQRPRYLFVLLLPVLPLVFNVMVHLYRTILNTMGITLIFNLGFSVAFTVFIVFLVFIFILSLILLSAQHD